MKRQLQIKECIEEEELKSMCSGESIRAQLATWCRKTTFPDFLEEIRKSVIGQEELEDVALAVYAYIEKMGRGSTHANSILLAAPSGCGKTETYRAMKEYFKHEIPGLPCYQVDVSAITQTGFIGESAESILNELYQHKETNGIGLVWLDEIDKKILPTYEPNGGNVNANVQYELLTIIEGRENQRNSAKIDTNNTMFIGLGAFDYFRKRKSEEINEIGFGSVRKKHEHYDRINRRGMIEAGGSYEFIGRFASIFNYHKLSDHDTEEIIYLMRTKEEESLDIKIEIREDALETFVAMNNSQFGCRLIRSAIHDRVMQQYKVLKMKRLKAERYRIVLSEEGDGLVEIKK